MPNDKVTQSISSDLWSWSHALLWHPTLLLDLQQAQSTEKLKHQRQKELWAIVEGTWHSIRANLPYENVPAYYEQDDDYYHAMREAMPDAPMDDLEAFRSAHVVFYEYTLRRSAVHNWIKERYHNTWRRAPYMPEPVLDAAIAEAIRRGEWYGVSHNGHGVMVDVFENAENVAPPWSRGFPATWSDYVANYPRKLSPKGGYVDLSMATQPRCRHAAIVLHLSDGVSRGDAIEALKRSWSRVEPYVGRRIGSRPKNRPKNYGFDARLYRVWYEWTAQHGKGVKEFARSFRLNESQGGWNLEWDDDAWDEYTGESTIEKHLRAARSWLEPIRDVPERLDAYLSFSLGK